MRRVQQPQAFRDARAQVFAIDLERQVAPHVDLPQIRRRVPVADPFGDDLADAARGLQADGIESGGDEAIAEFGRLAQVIAHVGRKTLRAAKEFLNARLLQGGDAAHGVEQHGFEVAEVAGDLAEGEVIGYSLGSPRAGVRLEGADQQLAGVVFEVAAMIVVAQHRHIGLETRHVLEQDVVVLAGMQRHGYTDAGGEIAGPHPAAQHDIVGLDAPAVGLHAAARAVRRDGWQ